MDGQGRYFVLAGVATQHVSRGTLAFHPAEQTLLLRNNFACTPVK
jgi:hypothetical protein